MSIVYIAGPMSNYEDYNFPAFHEAERQLMDEGYKVLSPARNFGGDQSLPYETYLAEAIRNVLDADWLYCLPGWRESKGARLEAHIASVLGKHIMEPSPDAPDGKVLPRRSVIIDKFGTPSAVTPEALDGPSRTTSTLVPTTAADFSAQRMHRALLGNFTPREITDFAGAVDGGGYKGSMDNPDKLPHWLVPAAFSEAAARALQHGAKRYAPNNWRKGMDFSEVYSALQRHMLAWLEREDIDPDSGLNHLDHAAACLAFLCEYVARPEYARFDNRVQRQENA